MPAGALFDGGIDRVSGLPVLSMYSRDSKRLPRAALDGFDTLVYDIQDVGCRYYTFISTLKIALEDCAANGKRLVVLDRPNPLGTSIEGCVLDREVESFVGCYDIPARYGLSCGEFALMLNAEEKLGCELHVVPCEGLTRGMSFPDWGKPWVMPSLAMPRYETALLYPGTCLIEGTNCSEGRGTADPFAIIGAPFVDAEELCREFSAAHAARRVRRRRCTSRPRPPSTAASCAAAYSCTSWTRTRCAPTSWACGLLDLLRRLYPDDFALPAAGARRRQALHQPAGGAPRV